MPADSLSAGWPGAVTPRTRRPINPSPVVAGVTTTRVALPPSDAETTVASSLAPRAIAEQEPRTGNEAEADRWQIKGTHPVEPSHQHGAGRRQFGDARRTWRLQRFDLSIEMQPAARVDCGVRAGKGGRSNPAAA